MKAMKWCFFISTILGFLALALLLVVFWGVNYNIVIHFDVFEGIDTLGAPIQVFLTTAAALFINFLFIILANYLRSREPFLAWALTLSNIGLMALSLAASIVIVVNN